jgi:heme/copper-type cytochrome/quinol oxidase subunit 3
MDEDEDVRPQARINSHPESDFGCAVVAGFAAVIASGCIIFFVWVATYVTTTSPAPAFAPPPVAAASALSGSSSAGLFALLWTLYKLVA